MELKRVVVTGLGAVTPIGNTAEETWQNMLAGVSGAAPITHFNVEKFKTQFACEVKDFDVTKYVDRKEARKMDPYCQYAMASATMAVEDSGMMTETLDKTRVGVVFGVGIGGMHTFEEESRKLIEKGANVHVVHAVPGSAPTDWEPAEFVSLFDYAFSNVLKLIAELV